MESQVLEGYQLSPQQKFLWPEQQRSPALCARAVVRIEGEVDGAALAAALQDVVDRHEILRTVFESLPGMDLPIQVVVERIAVACEPCDLGELPAEELPFDFGRPPLVRFRLAQSGPGASWLVISLPAVCADARTLANLAREIERAYQARRGVPETAEAAEAALQYIEFSEWRHSLLDEPDAGPGLAHWRRQREADPGPPVLPLETRDPGAGAFSPAAIDVPLEPAVRDLLSRRAEEWDATPPGILLAAWAALLRRLAGGPEITVHVRLDGRKFPELQGALGLFEQLLPVTLGVDLAAPLSALAGRADRVVEDAHVWQEYFVQAGGAPLPIAFESPAEEPEAPPGMPRFLVDRRVAHSAPFKLKLSATADAATLWYDSRAFDAAEAGRLAGRWAALLRDGLERPDAPLAELVLLGAAERHLVLEAWNGTAQPFPADAAIHRLFEAQADRTPDAPAVLRDGRALSFRELDARANRLARALRRLGVGPESLVVLCLERSEEMIVALLAILKAGGAYVPLDAGQPRARLARMLSDARVSLVVTGRAFAPVFEEQGVPVLRLDAERERLAAESAERPRVEVLPESPAYVIFTSGSTGQPKGVMIPHRAVANLSAALAATVYADAGGPLRVAVNAPLAFDASVKQVIQLLAGHALVVVPEEVRRDGDALLAFLAASGVEVLDATPAQVRLLLAAGLDAAACPSLRRVLVGGEAIDPALWRALADGPALRFWNVYGPTECTVDVTATPVAGAVPVLGRPLGNVRAVLLDAAGQPVPVGSAGELCVAGEGLARGYAHHPAATAARFVPDPFGPPGGRLYRTGDLARWRTAPDPGEPALEFLGRIDHQIKIRGFRIELGEIESVLVLHAEVREAVVAVRDDPAGDHRLVAYLVPAPAGTLDIDELRAFLRERLPEYMLPAAYVRLEALPLTRNGKVDRAALPDPEEASGRERVAGHEPPRNQVQELLAGLWAEILGYERIGIEANFFDLGGHSLLATQLISRVRQTLQVEVLLRSLFDAPTVAGLAEVVEEALRARSTVALPPLAAVPRDRPLPLSFAQQRLWFLDRLAPGNPFYNVPLRTRMAGRVDVPALERTLLEIVRRHEALRTRFVVVDGEPLQAIDPPPADLLRLVDLSALPEEAREGEALRLALEEARHPFDLERGPLVQSALLRLAMDDHIALLTTHHIVSDGWSMGVLIRELGELYDAFSHRRPSPLPELPIQYADFAQWQRSWLQGELLARHLDAWKRRLEGAPPVLELPTDRPRPLERTHRGGRRRLLFPDSLAEGMRQLCRRERVSLFMALLAGFQALLSRHAGQEDVSVGTPFSGRTRAETEGVIGFFVNTLVMRTDLSGAPDFRTLLGRVREGVLEADAHQDLPFELLVEELQPDRDPSLSPLFQVMFVLQNIPFQERELPGLALSSPGVETPAAKFDLTLTLAEVGGRLGGVLDYDLDLFDAVTAERLAGRLGVLLQALVEEPGVPIPEQPLLTPEERAQVVVEWSGAPPAWDLAGRTIPSLFAAGVERWPENPAVVRGDDCLTYRELGRRAWGLAHRLSALGVGPEVRVALCGPRSPEMVAALLAVSAAGGAWVPLEPSHPKERLAGVLADSGAAVLVTQGDPELAAAPGVVRLRLEGWTWEEREGPPPGLLDPEQAAYVIYTSGSTGRPKGVVVAHRGPCNLALAQSRAFGVTEESRVLQVASPAFDASVSELLMAFVAGATLVLRERERLLPGAGLEEVLTAEGITHATLPPSLLAALEERAFPFLESLIVAGEVCPPRLAERWGPGRRFFDAYGPTEASVCTTIEEWPGGRLTIGRPMAGVRVRLLDARLAPVPVGVAGELCVGGVGVARGYLGRPDLTAERFVPDSWGEPGSRMYRTGDLARWLPDGRLDFLGRRDRQVKVRGVRIELEEIEARLAGLPGLRESAVILAGAEEEKRLVAYVVCDPPGELSVQELRQRLADHLPEAMLPEAVVTRESLPRTTGGKLDRAALPDPGGSGDGGGYVAPRYLLEMQLCQVWEEILRVPRVGVRDNFFDLGGNSFLAIRLQARLETGFACALDLTTLLRASTVERLAGIVRRRSGVEDASCLALLRGGGGRQPFFWVHPSGGDVACYAGLVRHLDSDRPQYGLRSRIPPREGQTMEEMAADYLREIRAVVPHGPYLLGGWSMGGVVAFEMARQLAAQGEEVALLAQIDTQAPETRRAEAPTDLDLLRSFAAGLGIHDGFALEEEEMRLSHGELVERLLLRARAADLLPPDVETAELLRLLEVTKANTVALHGYRAGSYPGPITLFRATEKTDANPHRGWARLAGGGIDIHEIPGNHHSMIREPFVEVLAERLRACFQTVGV